MAKKDEAQKKDADPPNDAKGKDKADNDCDPKEESPVKETINTHKLGRVNKFAIPAVAGLAATALAHPFDVWKLNKQINIIESGPKISVLERLFKDRGLRGFLPGLSANLISQGIYQVVRIGTNGIITKDLDSIHAEPQEINDHARAQLVANMTGALMSTPAELALVSMATDRQQPPRFRKYYSGGYNSMLRTLQNGGLTASFRGAVTTIARTGLASMCNFVIYNKVKAFLTDKGLLKNEASKIVSGLVLSSIVTSLVTLPVDVLKTRYQTMRTCGGRPEFCGIAPLTINLAKCGINNFFRGFLPYTLRIAVFNFAFVGLFNALHKARDWIVDEPEEKEPPPEEPKEEPPPPEEDLKAKKGGGKGKKKKWRI